jgi:acetoin utilization protein AcuB
MTPCPITIGADQRVDFAHQLMREHAIRHLPVLKDGVLVGVVSQRDLYFVETLAGADPKQIAVEEAMSPDPFAVDGEASLERVAREMASRKLGCAVVMDGSDVVGLLTTTDALRALVSLLAGRRGTERRAARRGRA